MEMKKIACAVIFTAASIGAALSREGYQYSPAPAPAPGPSTGGSASCLPLVGSSVGASLASVIAYYLQCY
ncbi:hypothetical protein CJ030_MR1G017689 [Morella rubra]|uniref:Arabinogalactan peptide 23 n=1 Tax=Morella rubra TaxID=262757 RepID=A0A6A1WLW3_9ROSI|nr:hypothetical protein CJ030_MR1G017689 [Morella rubra]